MALSFKAEAALLRQDELELVRTSHHPFVHELDLTQLQDARSRLRDWRDKERTLAHHKRREARGKGDARGGSFPGTAEYPKRRKQVFASALKRVNKELERLSVAEARAAHTSAAHRALALRQAAGVTHRVEQNRTSNEGVASLPSRKNRTVVPPAKIGSVSQQGKNAQAKRDAK
jgi:hypothetical protein